MKAWELLSKPGAWTQKMYARDKDGNRIPSKNSDAACWCMFGAINRLYSGGHQLEMERRLCTRGYTASWNDAPERTQEEVVALLKSLDI